MPNRRLFSIARAQCYDLAHILPLLAIALILAAILAPTLTSFAAGQFASPRSPISPVRQRVLPPTFLAPAAGAAQTPGQLPAGQAVPQTPEKVQVTTPAVETPEQVQPPPPPPPPSPPVAPPVANPPPTLWIVVGLLVIGAIVAALIFLRKP
jgi:hypothetical protein